MVINEYLCCSSNFIPKLHYLLAHQKVVVFVSVVETCHATVSVFKQFSSGLNKVLWIWISNLATIICLCIGRCNTSSFYAQMSLELNKLASSPTQIPKFIHSLKRILMKTHKCEDRKRHKIHKSCKVEIKVLPTLSLDFLVTEKTMSIIRMSDPCHC